MRWAALLAVSALLLPACSEDQADVAEVVRASPEAMAEAGTVQMTFTVQTDGASEEGTAFVDFDRGLSSVVAEDDGSSRTTVTTPEAVYQQATLGLDDRRWIRADLEDADELAEHGIDVASLSGAAGPTPTALIDALASVTGSDVRAVGVEEVDGVETTHFRATLDLAAYVEQQAGSLERMSADETEAFLERYGDEPIVTEIWIDHDGRPRRFEGEFRALDHRLRMEAHISAFGEPVRIEVPADEDTVDALDVFEDLDDVLGG